MQHMSGTPFPTLLSLPYWVFFSVSQSLYWWTEYADLITKFSGIDRFEKEINCKNRGWRSYKLSGLLKKAGVASRNIAMKEQYTLLWSALLWTSFVLDRQVSILFYLWGCAACASPARTLCWKEGNQASIRNIFVNSKIRKNRSDSVWSPILKVTFKTLLTAFYIFTHDKWMEDWAFP